MYPIKTDKVYVTSKYGNRTVTVNGKTTTGKHHGIDMIAQPNKKNEDIIAYADGTVVAVRKTGAQYGKGCYIRLQHSNGKQTMYYHLKTNTIKLNKGDKVKKGDKLGTIGTTGNSTGVHLHFQIDKGSNATSEDPAPYLFEGKEFIPEPKPEPKPKPKPGFKVGDFVVPIKLIDYKGTKLIQYDKQYQILQIDKRGAVLVAIRKGKRYIWAVLSLDNIRRV